MKKLSFLLCLCLSLTIWQSCQMTDNRIAQTENVETKIIVPSLAIEPTIKPENKTQTFTGGKADFEGVSFAYNQKIFGNVEAELVPEFPLDNPDDKPDYVEPDNRIFKFDLPTESYSMKIVVYPINDFPRMYAVNSKYVDWMNQEITDFKKVLKNKSFWTDNEIPILYYREANQAFHLKVRPFSFPDGKGILFATFWNIDYEMPSNQQLEYIFEGLTNDGKYYVWAEMPLKVDFLSDTSTDEYDGYKMNWSKLSNKTEMRRYHTAIKKVAVRLENLPRNKFTPHLSEFEKIISSLRIERYAETD